MTWNNGGNAKKLSGDIKGAIFDFNQALEINPNYSFAYYNRGVAKPELGQINDACIDYEIALRFSNSSFSQIIQTHIESWCK